MALLHGSLIHWQACRIVAKVESPGSKWKHEPVTVSVTRALPVPSVGSGKSYSQAQSQSGWHSKVNWQWAWIQKGMTKIRLFLIIILVPFIIPIFCNPYVCFPFQRHFTVFAFNFPSLDSLNTIYSQILSFHLQQQAFGPSILRSSPALIQAAIAVHEMMVHHFLPTAVRFHYLFNLRDLSNVFQVP